MQTPRAIFRQPQSNMANGPDREGRSTRLRPGDLPMRTRLLAILLPLLVCVAAAEAADEPRQYAHLLGGHDFVPLLFVDRPFADSNARVTLGGAKRTLESASGQLELAGFSPKLDVQVKVWKELALSLGINASLVAGING